MKCNKRFLRSLDQDDNGNVLAEALSGVGGTAPINFKPVEGKWNKHLLLISKGAR